jgi:two-component system phosphate regulon sensor histidine kinase PhoR
VRNARLVWQIFPVYVAITLIALLVGGFLLARPFKDFWLDTVRQELLSRAQLIEPEVAKLLADGNSEQLQAEITSFGQKSSTRYTVIRPDGVVLADSDADANQMENHRERPEFKTALAGDVGVQMHYSATVAKPMLYVAVPVRGGGQLNGGNLVGAVRAAVPVAAIDEQLATLRGYAIAWSLLAATLIAGLSWFVARRIARPLDQMRAGAERFAKGELDYKLPIPSSVEMGGLARALNTMADQMQERIATIVRQSTEQNAVLASMVEGVLAVDDQQRIITLNSAAAELLEAPREKSIGRQIRDVVSNADLRRIAAAAIARPEPIQEDVVLDGSEPPRVIQVRTTTLGGWYRRHGAVLVLNDVTNVRRLESLRRDFVANVSHELKTPITSIKGFIETLIDGAIDNRADAERFLGIMAKQADRLATIVDDLLSLAKIEQAEGTSEFELQEIDLNEVIRLAVHACESLARERGVAIHFHPRSGMMAEINAPLLEQAVANLLDNAIKYSGADSQVSVSVNRTASEIVISVVDHGVGIEAEHLPRLFERFYRVDKARSRKLGGTGLGLSIVKHIVSAHGGHVSVQSQPGVGSTFTIHLPASGSRKAPITG